MENKKPEENKMKIEISKYKDLVDALGNPVHVARMVLLIAAVAAILAVGIIAVVCGIKRFYPYKSINSNPYGATIIQDEDNEIIYWLFNTADLWANSGIKVKEGDVISVHTSGAFHTAIHHLVKDANNNTDMKNLWVPSKGGGLIEKSPYYDRDKARLKFCIAPDIEYNTILMQVVPERICGNNEKPNWRTDPKYQCYVDGLPDTIYHNDYYKKGIRAKLSEADIYEIGSMKESIRIRTEGILHFAVNDIVLTPRIIDSMISSSNYKKELGINEVTNVWYAKKEERFDSLFTPDGLAIIKKHYEKKDNIKNITIKSDTISTDGLEFENLYRCNLIDKYGNINKKFWKKGIVHLYEHSYDSLWDDISYLKRMGFITSDTYSLKDTSIIKKSEYIADSLWDTIYQRKEKFHKKDTSLLKVNRKKTSKDSYIYLDSISLKDSTLTRYTISGNTCLHLTDSLCNILYLKRLEFVKNFRQPYETEYYKDTEFIDAWFVDNIGSFMIVIERKKVK